MEHRWSTRKPIKANAIVESPNRGKICATLRDVSLGGALVETDIENLPINTPVSVAFRLLPGDHGGDYRLHATVVRHQGGGAGLLFQDLDIDTIRSLRATLYNVVTPPPDEQNSRAA